jgi:hypothetical protein
MGNPKDPIMNQRERQPDPRPASPGDPSDAPARSELEQLHQQSQAFLEAGHQILNTALSGNSQAFLAANRQHGGQ